MGIKFKILLLTCSILVLLVACSTSYPSGAYFSNFEVVPQSQFQGVMKFVPNREWSAWQASEQVLIKEYGILSLDGHCSGRIRGEIVDYKAELAEKVKIVFRGSAGGEVSCLVNDSRDTKFVIFPILEKQSALSDGDMVGELYFSIPLNLQIR